MMSRSRNQNDNETADLEDVLEDVRINRARARRSANETETDQELSSYFDEFNWSVPVEHIAVDDEHSDIDEEGSSEWLNTENGVFSEGEIEDDDDDDEYLDENNRNDEGFQFKRRRLNSKGKFAKPGTQFKFSKPTKVIKCRQSKRIRAMAFNPKRNEIAAISMNAAFHYFDIQRFEQVNLKLFSSLISKLNKHF